ncbi:uncharacterized protein CC84DRAFT_1164429 [Paraphaeosphaeria sporulosa]|uniref:Uncharacterized protein n=1 Tax=Paraphaeosphaeria sporulosa TaxID=1460663 RepID=A0A177CEK5_9PLEO|nr:uncharacterized protein CC84DRAFT_1164429 [Paraphaeosphaeria sporulosa]OAG06064.1 hypothetical protein CC84DRAFT_1164429 [Paraphaeosphaeria sporulosa]
MAVFRFLSLVPWLFFNGRLLAFATPGIRPCRLYDRAFQELPLVCPLALSAFYIFLAVFRDHDRPMTRYDPTIHSDSAMQLFIRSI